jgi:Flp pilus assembly protein TadB
MKIVNLVLGLGTVIIVGSLLTLGIKAFYPEPVSPTYPQLTPIAYPAGPCATNDVACQKLQSDSTKADQVAQNKFNADQQTYQDAMKVYNRNLFIIANLAGIVVFALGFWLIFGTALAAQSVPIGIMAAGLWGIIYGYARGWDSVNDQLKFFIGLVIAALVLGGSMWLMERRRRLSTNNESSTN